MYTPDGKLELTNSEWKKNAYNSLPGFMTTAEGSNNAKLLNIITRIGNMYKNDMLRLSDQMNINNASGDVLTDIAKDYGITRIDDDDDFLRLEVKLEMWKNHLGPGFNSIKRIISYLFNMDEKDFAIVSTGLKSIKITNLPFTFDSGDKSDLKRDMIAGFIRSLLPSEYQLSDVEYQETADIWLFNGQRVTSPITLDAQQYICAEEYGASTITAFHASNASVLNATQQPPLYKITASSNNSYHAKQIMTINATQSRKDQ